MLIVDFDKETESYTHIENAQTADEMQLPISDAERIEALESALLELAEVVLNG